MAIEKTVSMAGALRRTCFYASCFFGVMCFVAAGDLGDLSPYVLRVQFTVGPAQLGQPFPMTGLGPYGLGPPLFQPTAIHDEQTLIMPPLLGSPPQFPDSADDDVYEFGLISAFPTMNIKIIDDGYPTVGFPAPLFGTGMFAPPPGLQPPPPQATLPTDVENIDALAVESPDIDFYAFVGLVFPGADPEPPMIRDMLLGMLPGVPPLFVQFSVDNSAMGLTNTAVAQESYWMEAAGDVFEACIFAPIGSNALIVDDEVLGLESGQSPPPVQVPPVDDNDGFIIEGDTTPNPPGPFGAFIDWTPTGWIIDTDGTGVPDTPFFYFSIEQPLVPFGLTPADILSPGVSPAPGTPALSPNIAISHLALGLQPVDNIDALFVDRTGSCVLFSLAFGSPSLATIPNLVTGVLGGDPGDLIFVNVMHPAGIPGPGGPMIVLSANEMGLMGSADPNVDELNGLWLTIASFIENPAPPAISSHPVDVIACPGDSATFTVSATGGRSLVYYWYKDGLPLHQYGPTLVIPSVSIADLGVYTCDVTNCFGQMTSGPANLVPGPLGVRVPRKSQARGLGPNTFDPVLVCAFDNIEVKWFDLNVSPTVPIKTYLSPPWALVVDTDPPHPSMTTPYRVQVSDELPKAPEQVSADVILLVAVDSLYFDTNTDNCNDVQDIWLLAEDWRQEMISPPDPNGDGIVDILDFLFINTDGYGCP